MPQESRQDGAALGTPEQPDRNPLLSEEGAAGFDLGDFSFAYEEGTGELVAVSNEPEPDTNVDPDAQAAIEQSQRGPDDITNLTERLKGLQRATTPVFQERNELRREVADLRKQLTQLSENDAIRRSDQDASAATQDLQNEIRSAIEEAVGADGGLLDGETLAKALGRALPAVLTRAQKQIEEKTRRLELIEAQLNEAATTQRIFATYGDRLPIVARVLQQRLEENPGLRDEYTVEQLLAQTHDDLVELARQELARRQAAGEPVPDPQEARRRAASNSTDPDGVVTPAGAPELPTSRPRSIDDAIAAAFKQTGFA